MVHLAPPAGELSAKLTERGAQATGRRNGKESHNKTSLRPFGQRLLSFAFRYGILLLGVVDKRQAVCPSGPTLCGQGRFLVPLTVSERGDLAMVTYSDLIQTGILIVAIIDVVLRLIEAERNRKQ